VFSSSSIPIDLSPAISGSTPLELDDPSAGPELDLDLPAPNPSAAPLHPAVPDDLGLAEPSKLPIRFDKPKHGAKPVATTPTPVMQPKSAELKLELEGEKPAVERERVAEKKQVAKSAEDSAAAAKKRRILLLGGILGLLVLGVGGWFGYQHFIADPKERSERVDELLGTARAALAASDAKHWDRAFAAANGALEVDDTNPEAIGIAAEAAVAGAWESGSNIAGRVKRARELLRRANDAGITGPRIARAQALVAMASGQQPEVAVKKLQQMAAANAKDPVLAMYLAWAQIANNDFQGGIATLALPASDDKTKLSALYLRGNAYLGLADIAHARADFEAVLGASKDHIGAQVGLASTLPPAQAQERETRLRSITKRKDFPQADERVRARVWTLLGDIDRQSGRLDGAREDYHEALKIAANDAAAMTGLAATELRDGKLDLAADQINKAVAQNGNDAEALLVSAEVAVAQKRFDDAAKVIDKLSTRDPALPPLQAAHMNIVRGRLAEAQGRDDDAVTAFVAAAKLAGDLDLAPTMLAVTKLNALAKTATGDNAAKYAKLRTELLASLDQRAEDDPKLKLALGQAYLEAGDPQKAADKLRAAAELMPTDPQAKLQLGRALAQLGQLDESLKMLDAAFDLDKSRFDIEDEIAQTLDNAKRTDDAAKAYAKLLALPDAPVGARVHAGRFYARIGDMKKAAEQGELILAKEPDNSAGHYLRGEGLLAAGKLDEARRELQVAVAADPENAQYLDSQGRAYEASYAATTDGKFLDNAIHVYGLATAKAPTMLNPPAGLGRIYVQRREFEKAEVPLGNAYHLDEHNAEVLFNLGLVNIRLASGNPQRYGLAIKWLNLALHEKPTAEAYYQLGELYRDPNVNQPAKAIDSLRQATQLGAKLETPNKKLEWLTMAYYRLGQLLEQRSPGGCEAKEPYVQFLQRQPPDGTERRAADQWLGENCRR
jgi:tetratricopeptide (TPR) repeat protein